MIGKLRAACAWRWFWLALVLGGVLLPPATAADSAPGPSGQAVDYMILVTGGELLGGAYPDAHTVFLTRTLRPLGLHCVGSLCVDDKPADILEGLRFASGRAPLVIVTGGLGPTENDLTRQSLAEFTGIALREHPEVLAAMERRFGLARDQLRPNLRAQTLVPERGTYLPNPNGTSVGLVFEMAGKTIVALPGPPRELQPMVRDALVPYLSRRFGTRAPGATMMLRFVGLGQSQISQTFKDRVPVPADVAVFSQFEGSRVDYTFTLVDDSPQARARLQELKQKILKELGDNIYADDPTTLEEHVARGLESRGATLAVAEVGSAGALAAGLAAVDGKRPALAGAYVAPTEEQMRRLLRLGDEGWKAASATERIALLAAAAAESSGSQAAVAVGEARQDAGGNRFVEVVLRLPGGRVESQRLAVRGSGELARANLATQLLDQLRRRLR